MKTEEEIMKSIIVFESGSYTYNIELRNILKIVGRRRGVELVLHKRVAPTGYKSLTSSRVSYKKLCCAIQDLMEK